MSDHNEQSDPFTPEIAANLDRALRELFRRAKAAHGADDTHIHELLGLTGEGSVIEATRQTFGIVIECTGLTDRGIEGGVFIPEAEFVAGYTALAAENERLRQELAGAGEWQDASTPPPMEREYERFSVSVDVELLMIKRGFYEQSNIPTVNSEWKPYAFDVYEVIGWRYREEGGEDGE